MPSVNDPGVNKKIVTEVIEPFHLFSNSASFFNIILHFLWRKFSATSMHLK